MAELLNDLGERGRPGSIEKAAHAWKLLVVGAAGACATKPARQRSPRAGSPRIHNVAVTADGGRGRLEAMA
jgi:hypothetical protein